jgi:hypothetical protein
MALSTAVFIGESKEWYDLPPSSLRPCRVSCVSCNTALRAGLPCLVVVHPCGGRS